MSRVMDDESERTDLYQRRSTPRENQKRRNLERMKEAKRLLQSGSGDRD